AADPAPGFLQPAAPAKGIAREGLCVHAAFRAHGRPHLELPPHDRRFSRWAALREVVPGIANRERESARATDRGVLMPTFAEMVEGVRTTIAEYAHALDDGRTEDILVLFCEDGSIDMPGIDAVSGRVALRATYEKLKPRVPQRHVITNTVVVAWN